MDGRPTPLGVRSKCMTIFQHFAVLTRNSPYQFQARQTARVKKQREYAQKIVTAIREVDFAKERYQKITQATADERQSIMDGKLKPKGTMLLKK